MKVSMVLAPAVIAVLVGGITSPTVVPDREVPSARSLRLSVEAALERGDVPAALRKTEAAHRRAIRDGSWESLIEVGDAYSRIAAEARTAGAASERAWDAYRAALRGARRGESLDGVLRAAEGFAQLGDAGEVSASLHIARELAGSDPEAVDDVRAVAGRLSDLLAAHPEGRHEE